MFKISFQRFGSACFDEIVFKTRIGVDLWLAKHQDSLSCCKVREVFN